jgi:Concanavalin A-like lectin/glucanases superfamily/Bacterial TSP3 repeat
VYYKQPNLNGVDSVIRAQAGGNNVPSNAIDFTCHTNLLVALWKFNETSGSTALDTSPIPSPPPTILPSNGTITGAVRELSFLDRGSIPSDSALRFDGVDDFVTAPHLPPGAQASKLEFSNANFSVSAWVKLDSGTDLSSDTTVYPIVSKWATIGNGFEFAIKGGATANGLTFRTMSNGVPVQEIVPIADQRTKLRDTFPHLVTFTRDGTNVGRLYVDGVEVGSLLNVTGSLTTTAKLFLGKNDSGKYFKGLLDDVKILTTTFRADEIAAAFDADGDGMPDWWEAKYFGNLNGTNNPNADSDGDGMTDGDEFKFGRNPNAGVVTNNNLELIIFTPTHN